MATYAVLLVLACLIPVVPGQPGHTKMCRHCPYLVRGPDECKEIHHCPEPCLTEVFFIHGRHMFSYSCGHPDSCEHEHHHPPEPHHGQRVCKECCHSTGCDQTTCFQFLTTTPASTTTTTTTTTTTQAPTTTRTTTTSAPTTIKTTTTPDPTATTVKNIAAHQSAMVTQTTSQPCTDSDDVTFTCAVMVTFGYCDPKAGAGHALAQQRCRKTCGFCP